MYNPYQAPGQYGAPPGDYGAFAAAPPGMAPPPGMAAPGMGAPPGMQQAEAHQQGRPGAFPSNFQPPANMPNINFSAPVIRLGTSGPVKSDNYGGGRDDRERGGGGGGGGRRAGLGSGMGQDSRGQERERITQVHPPTKEEIVKTLFVGGITEGIGGDAGIERILRAAGNLRRWTRATDADDKPCKFGFAEYDDPESLGTAIEVLRDVQVPVKRQTPGGMKSEDEDVKTSTLLIIADDNSLSYIQQWEDSQGGQDAEEAQMRLDHARNALEVVLNDLTNPSIQPQKDDLSNLDHGGDTGTTTEIDAGGDVVTIPIPVDDELADIPAEMRETVAKEITAFRDRSNRRDLERLKREEEIELLERNRMMNGSANRLSSPPPPSAPSGPAGGANGIPVGPRDRGALNAPSGPKGFGQQIPRDYQKGVTFVNGTGISAASAFEEVDTDASDEELERRRKGEVEAEHEKSFLDQERRWLNRERSRTAAVEREKARDTDETTREDSEKAAMAKRLKEWNDDAESSRKGEEYYADHSMWTRNRTGFRSREVANDDADRLAEQRERAREFQQKERAGAMADDFLSRQDIRVEPKGEEREERREPARFKLSLGAAAAAQKAQASAAQQQKRTVADVEGLLEDEEEDDSGQKRTLVPIQFDKNDTAGMSDEERAQAAKQLAADIPNDKEGLWRWEVKWEFVDESVIEERLKPFVEKKIVEYLGVQEQMLVDVVVDSLRSRGKPTDLVGALEGALEDEAEVLVRKLWRMVIFFSESEKRGLSA